jgi:predicted alpha/beta superfamily hydrolase
MSAKWKQSLASTSIAIFIAGTATAYVQRGAIFEALDRRPLPELEVIDYYSETIDQPYVLYVQLPPGYDPYGRRYPVLYAVDGDSSHELYDELILPLIRQRRIPPIITVGIGYRDVPPVPSLIQINRSALTPGNEETKLNAAQVRVRDYTPVETESATHGGGAPEFLAFITDKVVPFIDATYHTDPGDRAIAGHSLGGLFSLYAWFCAPEVFNRCVSTSPSLFWGRRNIFEHEKAFAESQPEREARVYLGLGTDESTILSEAVNEMMETLSERDYPNIAMKHEWHEGENHMSVILPAARAGLEFIY